jgi:molecular chaperone DnaJ
VLGVSPAASAAEIKAAYRALVKQHHPDAGGDATTMLALNAAWEVLGDGARRRAHDQAQNPGASTAAAAAQPASASPRARSRAARAADLELEQWLQQVVAPIERQLAQVLGPVDGQIKALAADPYDDSLMEAFCAFLEQCQARLERVETLFRSRACPASAQGFGLSLYQCLSLVKDALAELERYTMGYVDSYLHDGRQMLREARRLRAGLQHERSQLSRAS